jgi:hypothetical protein
VVLYKKNYKPHNKDYQTQNTHIKHLIIMDIISSKKSPKKSSKISQKIPPEIWGIVVEHLLTINNDTFMNYNNFKRALVGINSSQWSAVLEYVNKVFTKKIATMYRMDIKTIYDINKTSSILPHLYTLSDYDLVDIFLHIISVCSINKRMINFDNDIIDNDIIIDDSCKIYYDIFHPNDVFISLNDIILLCCNIRILFIDKGEYIDILYANLHYGWNLLKLIKLYKNGTIENIVFNKNISNYKSISYDTYSNKYYYIHDNKGYLVPYYAPPPYSTFFL